jgi:signal transduction histidine kinase
MAAAVPALWPRRARPLVPLLPVTFGVVALIVVGAARTPGDLGPTTYAGVSTAAYAIDLAAGLSILAAASVALLYETTAVVGWIALLGGVVWFAQDWEGWSNGPALVRSLAAALVPLLVVPPALLFAGVRSRMVSGAAAVLCLTALARASVRDPLFDRYCWRDCVSRTLVLHSAPGLTRVLDRVWLGTTVALGGVVLVAAVRKLAAATGPARRALAPVLLPGALVCGAVAAYAVALLVRPIEQPDAGLYSALFYVRAGGFAAVASGLALTTLRRRRQRAAVSRLADELVAVPDALARAFGDPTLQVAYWLPAAEVYVEAGGRRVDRPAAGNGRAVTPIVHSGRPVALVSHDASLPASPELGSAARLALENERLQAEVCSQLEALRLSRTRITERGDSERRRLERDLHDGAQQRLLALSFDLRLARSAAAAAGDWRVTATLNAAIDEAQSALEELRELAHGIYPAVLTEAGLPNALATLTDEAPVPVELTATVERFDAAVEAAIYIAVREAIDDAARREATSVTVRLEGRVALTVEDDGAARSSPLVHVADRIGALGGETTFGASSLRAEIACE